MRRWLKKPGFINELLTEIMPPEENQRRSPVTEQWQDPRGHVLDKYDVELPIWMWNEIERQAKAFGVTYDQLLRVWLGERLRPKTVD